METPPAGAKLRPHPPSRDEAPRRLPRRRSARVRAPGAPRPRGDPRRVPRRRVRERDGRARRAIRRVEPARPRLRRRGVPADVDAPRGGGHRDTGGLRRGPPRARAGPDGDWQRGRADAPRGGGGARAAPRAGVVPRGARTRLPGGPAAGRRGGHARQDDHDGPDDACLPGGGPRPRLPRRRRDGGRRGDGRARLGPPLRRRGRRVRRGVLRQAAQDAALPPAGRRGDEPRV